MLAGMRFRCLLLLLLASPLAALAQSWPTQTVRVMVGFPPGGTTDIVGRLVANELSEQLGRTLVVENRGGASGTIGAGLVASTPYVFVVHPDMPVKSFGSLIALLKANPGKYNYASTSPGTAQHLGGELVKKMAGVDMVHIATITQHIRKGTLRPLAVSSIKRTPLMPEVPTVSETGLGLEGFEVLGWFALLAPAKTPQDASSARRQS